MEPWWMDGREIEDDEDYAEAEERISELESEHESMMDTLDTMGEEKDYIELQMEKYTQEKKDGKEK